MMTALISIPLTIDYLGTERYGLWMTIGSVTALLGFADFGIGNGLLNAIAAADGKNDRGAACRSVSSTFFILTGIALLLLALLTCVYPFVPWQPLFNVTSDLAAEESGPATALLIAIFAMSMPLGIVQRVQMGYQEGFVSHLWTLAGALLGFIGLLVVTYLEAGLPWLVLALSGGPLLVLVLNWSREFLCLKPWLLPSWKTFDWETGRRIVHTGILFLVLQIFTIIGYSSDNLIIAQLLGVSAVTIYAIVQKLFLATLLAQYFLQPLWPAFGEAMARKDIPWARRTLNRALVLSLSLGVFTGLPLIFFGKRIVSMLAGNDLTPSAVLLSGFALWVLVTCVVGSISTFLNSGTLVGRQVPFFVLASLSALVLKVVGAHYWQTEGVVWGTVVAYGVFYILPATQLAYKSLQLPSVNPTIR